MTGLVGENRGRITRPTANDQRPTIVLRYNPFNFLVVRRNMKAYFIFCLLSGFLFSCSKDHKPTHSQSITGTLRYSSPVADGIGLYYVTDENEPLLFKNEFSDFNAQYQHYIDFVDAHSRLTFVDHGETGCSLGMLPCPQQHPMRLVEVVKLDKE
jgi:hypothetical protein